MKVKCYAIMANDREVMSEYANLSQKNFLSFELTNITKKLKRTNRIDSEQTSNGIWYYKQSETTKNIHLTLLQASSLNTASSLIAKGIEYEASKMSDQKLRMKIAEQIKIINANSKMDTLNSNVMELQNIMKGNVSKIIGNMSDLETAEQKSERLSSLSRQFETDSRALEEKLKKKACMRKLIIGGIGGALVVFFIYYFFL